MLVKKPAQAHCQKLMPLRAVVDLGGAQGSHFILSWEGTGPHQDPVAEPSWGCELEPKKTCQDGRNHGCNLHKLGHSDTAPIVLAIFSPRQIKWNCTRLGTQFSTCFFSKMGGTPLNHQFPLNRNDCLTCLITSGPPDFRSQIDPAHLGLLLLQAQETHRVAVFHWVSSGFPFCVGIWP